MNPYQKYKEDAIYSMSRGELLLVLFDEALGRLRKAEIALEDQEYEIFEDCLNRVNRILRYLIDILDRSQPLSYDLRRIYRYLFLDVAQVKAGREHKKDEIGRIAHILQELRDAFDAAAKEARDVSAQIPIGSDVYR